MIWGLFLFSALLLSTGGACYYIGLRRGQQFVALLLSYELEDVIYASKGHVYQRLRFAMDKYL